MGTFNLIPTKGETDEKAVSRPIVVYRGENPLPSPTAEELMLAYRLHPNRLENSNGQTIKGFTVDLSHLGIDKKIFIAFGVNPDDFSSTTIPWDKKGFTTIIFNIININGVDILDTSTAVDFCDPCPPMCPTEIGFPNGDGTFTKRLQLCNNPASPTCQ